VYVFWCVSAGVGPIFVKELIKLLQVDGESADNGLAGYLWALAVAASIIVYGTKTKCILFPI
jgi:hypothetical protein